MCLQMMLNFTVRERYPDVNVRIDRSNNIDFELKFKIIQRMSKSKDIETKSQFDRQMTFGFTPFQQLKWIQAAAAGFEPGPIALQASA